MLVLGADGAAAERRPAASYSYCGFGHGAADSSIEPGAGGDTIEIGDPEDIYHFVFDSSSPITLEHHDRIVFTTILPAELSLKRVGDGLAICHETRRYELFLDGHYCRAQGISGIDFPNSEFEEIAFLAAGEIWLADILFAERERDPASHRPPSADGAASVESSQWKYRPFSKVIPEWRRPAPVCP